MDQRRRPPAPKAPTQISSLSPCQRKRNSIGGRGRGGNVITGKVCNLCEKLKRGSGKRSPSGKPSRNVERSRIGKRSRSEERSPSGKKIRGENRPKSRGIIGRGASWMGVGNDKDDNEYDEENDEQNDDDDDDGFLGRIKDWVELDE